MLRTLAGCKLDDCIFLSRKKEKSTQAFASLCAFRKFLREISQNCIFFNENVCLRITPPPGAGLLAVGVAWLLRSQRDKHSGDSLFVHLKYLVDA